MLHFSPLFWGAGNVVGGVSQPIKIAPRCNIQSSPERLVLGLGLRKDV
jgi:hypothetical protein